MLESIFMTILNLSFNGSIAILVILLIRLLLKRVPKIFSYALWSVALFRLVCPFSFESIFSIIPAKANPIPPDIAYQQVPSIDTGITILNNAVNPILPPADVASSVNPLQVITFMGNILWICGIVLILIYSVISLVNLNSNIKNSKHYKENIFISENIKTPFVLGLLKPKIYIPDSVLKSEEDYIILHEKTHIRRFDHVVKIISFLVLCVHWFNPLVWVAFSLCEKDMEMSCDERVLREMGGEIKKNYSSSLLSLSTGKRLINGTPLAFGEGNPKGRIKNILNYKKPALWVIIVSVIVIAVAVIGLSTNPKQPNVNDSVDLSDIETMNIGAEMPWIIYADQQKVVLTGTFGVVSYDLDKNQVTDRISYTKLKEMKIDFLSACISSDGNVAYLQNFNPSAGISDDEYYEYDFTSRKYEKKSGEIPSDLFAITAIAYDFSENSAYNEFINQGFLMGEPIQYGTVSKVIMTRAKSDWSMKSLEIVILNVNTGESTIHPVFNSNTQPYTNSDDSAPLTSVTAKILDIDKDYKSLMVSGLDENSMIGDRCYLTCKDAEIIIDGEVKSFSDLKLGNIIEFPCEYVNETYPTSTTTPTIKVVDKGTFEPILKFNTAQLESDYNIENVSILAFNKYMSQIGMYMFKIVDHEIISGDIREFQCKFNYTYPLNDDEKQGCAILNVLCVNGNSGDYYITGASDGKENPILSNGTNWSVIFPAYKEDNVKNSTVPFTLNLNLPNGYKIADLSSMMSHTSTNSFPFTPVYIVKDDKLVGMIGFNTYVLYETEAELPKSDFPQSIYADLFLSSACVWSDYTPVKTTDTGETATATVMYNSGKFDESLDVKVPGILSYNQNKRVYIGIRFEENVVSDAELKEIAESITIS